MGMDYAPLAKGEQRMKFISIPVLLGLALFTALGCSTTSRKEKAAAKAEYFEEGKMDDQVQSWKRHGRY
jgi:hypothetical protein